MVGGEVAVGGGGGQALARDVAVTRVLYRAVDLNISQLVSGGVTCHIFIFLIIPKTAITIVTTYMSCLL